MVKRIQKPYFSITCMFKLYTKWLGIGASYWICYSAFFWPSESNWEDYKTLCLYFVFFSTTLLLILISVLTWEVTKYIYSVTVQVHTQGALPEYFHFVKLYIEVCTPLHLTDGSSYWLLFRLPCCPMETTEVLMLNVCVKLTVLLKEPKSHTRVMLIPVNIKSTSESKWSVSTDDQNQCLLSTCLKCIY